MQDDDLLQVESLIEALGKKVLLPYPKYINVLLRYHCYCVKNEYSVPATANFAKTLPVTLVDLEVDPLALNDEKETALTVPMKNNHDNVL